MLYEAADRVSHIDRLYEASVLAEMEIEELRIMDTIIELGIVSYLEHKSWGSAPSTYMATGLYLKAFSDSTALKYVHPHFGFRL